MVEISRPKTQHRFPKIASVSDDIPDHLLTENEGYDFEDETFENLETDLDSDQIDSLSNTNNIQNNNIQSHFAGLWKLQRALDQISFSLGQFVRERLEIMERNIFRLNNEAPLDIPNMENIPLDVRTIAYLLAQGDNRNVEELLRTVHQNVVVNVNLSYYFKIMLVMLTFNTLLLFKWMVWDQL